MWTNCENCGKKIGWHEETDDPKRSYDDCIRGIAAGISNVDASWLNGSPGQIVTMCKSCHQVAKDAASGAVLTVKPVEEEEECGDSDNQVQEVQGNVSGEGDVDGARKVALSGVSSEKAEDRKGPISRVARGVQSWD